MASLKNIDLDLINYTVQLHFKENNKSLLISFDTPSRKFYFSIIALVVNEMKSLNKQAYIHIRKYEKPLKLIDQSLGGPQYRSKTVKGMWDKIRKAWRYTLPDLETASNFKILNRKLIPPYGKGEKHTYDCSDDECDIWANLFMYDKSNTWRFKFDLESSNLNLDDISLHFGNLRDKSAWQEFLKQISQNAKTQATITEDREIKEKNRYLPAIITVFALIVSIVFIAIFYLYETPSKPAIEYALHEKPSIMVLPFINVSDNPTQEYFCDGITEEIINNLARLKDLRVISRTSSFYFQNKDLDLRTIGEKLKVDNILEGSVRVSGDKLKISAQLIKVADDSHLWAQTYERKMKDIFDTQQNLAHEIACSLKSRLGCENDAIMGKRSTDNIEAYHLFLKGRYFLRKRTVEDYNKAINYFEQSLKLSPNYGAAYAGLSSASITLTLFEPPLKYYLKAKEAAINALELDPTLVEAITALGKIKLYFEWDWSGAESLFKRAIDLNPDYPLVHHIYSTSLIMRGRSTEGIYEIKKAQELDPLSILINFAVGDHLRWTGQVDEAIEEFKKTLELSPNFNLALGGLGWSYAHKGLYEKAISILEKGKALHPTSPIILSTLGYAYSLNGQKENARQILFEALELRKQHYYPANIIAALYVSVDEKDMAFQWLATAYEERDANMHRLKVDPLFDKLQSDPRWKTLLNKMGLEE